jgi:hypothetical protein
MLASRECGGKEEELVAQGPADAARGIGEESPWDGTVILAGRDGLAVGSAGEA